MSYMDYINNHSGLPLHGNYLRKNMYKRTLLHVDRIKQLSSKLDKEYKVLIVPIIELKKLKMQHKGRLMGKFPVNYKDKYIFFMVKDIQVDTSLTIFMIATLKGRTSRRLCKSSS